MELLLVVLFILGERTYKRIHAEKMEMEQERIWAIENAAHEADQPEHERRWFKMLKSGEIDPDTYHRWMKINK